jgi:glycosyltransferase involved in cell wall biosynthesis
MADVAILIPVLNRPHRVEPVLTSIAAATDVPYAAIFAASDQPTIDELERLGARYDRDEGGTYPERINRLFRLTTEPYVFLGADDLDFRVGWFQAALRVMETIEGGGIIAINDLHNGNGVHFLVSRRYIDEVGGVMDRPPGTVCCEEYRHQFVDDELRHTAAFRGRFAHAPDSIVEHLHPGAGKAPSDDTYQLGESTFAQGHEMFMRRRHLWGQ